MKTGFVFLLILTLVINYNPANAQPFPTIEEHEYYDFYNSLNAGDSINPFYLSDKQGLWGMVEFGDTADVFSDTIFTKADVTFLKYQLKKCSHFKWKDGTLYGATIIAEERIEKMFERGTDGWQQFYKNYGNTGFHKYSVPLFSVDKSLCIVYMGFHCGGLCGEGSTRIYKKKHGYWHLVKEYGSWVS